MNYQEIKRLMNEQVENIFKWELIDVANACHVDYTDANLRSVLDNVANDKQIVYNQMESLIEAFTFIRDTDENKLCNCGKKALLYMIELSSFDGELNNFFVLSNIETEEQWIQSLKEKKKSYQDMLALDKLMKGLDFNA